MRANFLRAGLFGGPATETKAPYKIEQGQTIVQDQPVADTPRPSWIDRKLDRTLGDIVQIFSPLR